LLVWSNPPLAPPCKGGGVWLRPDGRDRFSVVNSFLIFSAYAHPNVDLAILLSIDPGHWFLVLRCVIIPR